MTLECLEKIKTGVLSAILVFVVFLFVVEVMIWKQNRDQNDKCWRVYKTDLPAFKKIKKVKS